ncbi:putative homeodomain protein [Ostreococcus tauri]|uniref:Putative homeodomain protein n=1 Tax=Ostreococcus tauri TaxID=70448 RepID=A0A1Y5IEA3_OSTTA|nr:putative homeodomain protein [Ostreococcus tauri]
MTSGSIDGLDLLFDHVLDAREGEGAPGLAVDVLAWDDVLNAFDAYCADGADGRFDDLDAVFAMTWAREGCDARRRAAGEAREYIASVVRDALGDGEDDDGGDARETTRREAEDSATAIKYVQSRANGRLRASCIETGRKNPSSVCAARRGARATSKGRRSENRRLLLRREFKSSLANVLDAFDSAMEHIAPRTAKTKSASSRDSERSNATVEITQSVAAIQGRHDERARRVLSQWLWDHFYPTEERLKPIPTRAEKEELARLSGLTTTQVGDWFVNARARLWKPYIEGLIRGVYNDAMVKKALDLQADASA